MSSASHSECDFDTNLTSIRGHFAILLFLVSVAVSTTRHQKDRRLSKFAVGSPLWVHNATWSGRASLTSDINTTFPRRVPSFYTWILRHLAPRHAASTSALKIDLNMYVKPPSANHEATTPSPPPDRGGLAERPPSGSLCAASCAAWRCSRPPRPNEARDGRSSCCQRLRASEGSQGSLGGCAALSLRTRQRF